MPRICFLVGIVSLVLSVLPSASNQAVTDATSHQGRLTDSSGKLAEDGMHPGRSRLHKVETGGLDRRYLAVDRSLHANLRNVHVVMGQATNRREILSFDGPWEIKAGISGNLFRGVVKGHDGIFRAYYEVSLGPDKEAVGLAYSTDAYLDQAGAERGSSSSGLCGQQSHQRGAAPGHAEWQMARYSACLL